MIKVKGNGGEIITCRDQHGFASLCRFMIWVVAATASGQDIAIWAPPVPMPWVVQVFLHVWVILNLHTTFQNGWIAFRLPPIVNAFGCMLSTFSSWWLQNCTVFHILSSAANHPFSQQLLRLCEMSHWTATLLHRWYDVFSFSYIFFC